MLTHHDANQIDRFTGAIRLTLPRSLHLGLVDLLNRELKALPAHTGAAVKENCIAAVSLILKSSKTEEIYAAEAARQIEQDKTDRSVEQAMRFEAAANRHRYRFDAMAELLFCKQSRDRICEEAFAAFCTYLADEPDGLILIEWAKRNLDKRKELHR